MAPKRNILFVEINEEITVISSKTLTYKIVPEEFHF